jgi:hypothetical protein
MYLSLLYLRNTGTYVVLAKEQFGYSDALKIKPSYRQLSIPESTTLAFAGNS